MLHVIRYLFFQLFSDVFRIQHNPAVVNLNQLLTVQRLLQTGYRIYKHVQLHSVYNCHVVKTILEKFIAFHNY